jgi:predicted secreted hydrolase
MKHRTNPNYQQIYQSLIGLGISRDGRSSHCIARDLSVDPANFHRIQNGHHMPKVDVYLKIKYWLRGLGIEIEPLLINVSNKELIKDFLMEEK